MKTMTLCLVVFALVEALLFLSKQASYFAAFVSVIAAIVWGLMMWHEGTQEQRDTYPPTDAGAGP